MNKGYPLLDEDAVVTVPAEEVVPRDGHAAEDIANCLQIQKPALGYQERCYYFKFQAQNGLANIYQLKLNTKLTIQFDAEE